VWASGQVWTGAENLVPTGIRFPDLPARRQQHKEYAVLKEVVFECLASQAYSTTSCQSVISEEQSHCRQAYVVYTCPLPLIFLWRGHHFRCSVCKMHHHKMPSAFSSVGHYGIGCTTQKFLNRCLKG